MHVARWSSWVLILASLVVVSCAPSAPNQSGAAPSGPVGQPSVSQAPKVMTIAFRREPSSIEGFSGAAGTAGGAGEIRDLIHDHLTKLDPNENPVVHLATELPSVENGLWRVNDDGSMDMTWKLRPNVLWHDGAPFTSEDLLFSFTLHKDRDLSHAYGAVTRLMESASAPDPLTFTVHWSVTYPKALEAVGLSPVPRHLLEELYRTDKDAFMNSPRFGGEFIGLGPYRLLKWEPSSHMEMERFDRYYMGRPPLDRVVMRFVFDQNTLIANMLAGTIDLAIPPSVDLDGAVEVKQRWEGTGNQVRIEPVNAFQYIELQFQPQYARPLNGIPNRMVRQAMYQALNRDEYAATISHGLGPAADSWYAPNDPIRKEFEGAIPSYPYDPNRAQQLLNQAGWTRGSDGILVHQPSGERMELELWSNSRQGERPAVVLAEDWKAAGASVQINPIPVARADDREYLSKYPAALLARLPIRSVPGKADSRLISSAENRWTGSNRSGYTNQRADAILDQLASTIDRRVQIQLQREQVNILMSELAFYPLAWEVLPILALRGVKGDIRPFNTGWNTFEWTKE
jgi:peptide/nickel transport system substrate-binding protein